MPCENAPTRTSATASRPVVASAGATARRSTPCSAQANRRFSAAVRSAYRRLWWPRYSTRCRIRSRARTRSWPSTVPVPNVGESAVATTRSSVDLPDPLGPRSQTVWPAATSRSTAAIAGSPSNNRVTARSDTASAVATASASSTSAACCAVTAAPGKVYHQDCLPLDRHRRTACGPGQRLGGFPRKLLKRTLLPCRGRVLVALVEYAVAVSGGVVSFLSPCVLPLVPVYLSISTGLGVSELEAGGRRHAAAVLRGSGLFVAGFAVVFVALGSSATAVGTLFARHQLPLSRAGGALVVALGLLLLLGTRWAAGPFARDLRSHPRRVRWRSWGPPVSGAAFA